MTAMPVPVSLGLKTLNPIHHRILDLHLGGMKNIDIAKLVGQTKENVYLVLASPLAQDEIARRRLQIERGVNRSLVEQNDTALGILKENEAKAAQNLVSFMQEGNEAKLRLQATESILDRCGVGRTNQTAPITQITVERMQVLVQALKEDSLLSAPAQQKELSGSQAA